MPTDLLIIGAGGHAKVVIEACNLSNPQLVLNVVDQSSDKVDTLLFEKYRVTLLDFSSNLPNICHIAIGNNKIRRGLFNYIKQLNRSLHSVLHPDALISPSARIHDGSFIAARTVIAAESIIEPGCIVNHGAVVDHDCHIGAFSHIAPHSTLCGGVRVGEGVLIGAGATVLPMVKIGKCAVIGAGAVVTSNIPEGKTVTGIPGKAI